MNRSDDRVGLVDMGVYATKAINMLGRASQDDLEQNEMMQFALNENWWKLWAKRQIAFPTSDAAKAHRDSMG